jgi:hypothetical protein
MLTSPSVHPFLLAVLRESLSEMDRPTNVPQDSWPAIIEEAITQRIAPLLFLWLNHPAHQHQVPAHLLAVLKQGVMQHAAWTLLLTTELRSILVACEQRGIPCVPIRGPALAEQLYGDCSIRQMDDLDLLVHRTDLSAIKDLFQQRGYAFHEHRPGFLERFSYSLEFIHPQHGFVVEPHWTLAYPPCTATAAMQPVWARTTRTRWMEMDTWTLSNEDLLLHLCLHLHHKGQQAPLLWFHELDTVIRQHGPTLDWNIFMEQVQLMEQTRAVGDVLTVTMRTFHSPVPDSVVRQCTAQARDTFFPSPFLARNQTLARSSLRGREEFALLCSLQSLPQRLRYLSALLFPSPQYMTQRYGACTFMSLLVFYFARFFHIGAEGFRCAVVWIVAMRQHRSVRQ